MESLLIQFRDNDTAHDDLHVCIAGYSRVADTYYFALDPSMFPGDESPNKVRRVLIQLLQRWTDAVAKATPTQPVYLPFDFSDQYTGCFQCRPDGEYIEIVAGWSHREGWSLAPSDPGEYLFNITDFKSDAAAPVKLPRDEFFHRIQQSIADAESQLSKAEMGTH